VRFPLESPQRGEELLQVGRSPNRGEDVRRVAWSYLEYLGLPEETGLAPRELVLEQRALDN
jgi:hypothetical protein